MIGNYSVETYITDAEPARLLAASESTGEMLRLQANGTTYLVRVEREDDRDPAVIAHTPNPDQVSEALLRKYAGSWGDLDADELIETLYQARAEGTRLIDRP